MSIEHEQAGKEMSAIQLLLTGQRERFLMEATDLAHHQLQHNPALLHQQIELLDQFDRQMQILEVLERLQ